MPFPYTFPFSLIIIPLGAFEILDIYELEETTLNGLEIATTVTTKVLDLYEPEETIVEVLEL